MLFSAFKIYDSPDKSEIFFVALLILCHCASFVRWMLMKESGRL